MLVIIILQVVTLVLTISLVKESLLHLLTTHEKMPNLLPLMLRTAKPVRKMHKPTDSKLFSAFMSDQF